MSKELQLNVTGEGIVYRNDKYGYPAYYFMMHSRINNYDTKKSLSITFTNQNVDISNGSRIEVKSGFLSFTKNRNNEFYNKLIITDFQLLATPTNDINVSVDSNKVYEDDLWEG